MLKAPNSTCEHKLHSKWPWEQQEVLDMVFRAQCVWDRSSPSHVLLPATSMEPESHSQHRHSHSLRLCYAQVRAMKCGYSIIKTNTVCQVNNSGQDKSITEGCAFNHPPQALPDQTVPKQTLPLVNLTSVKSCYFSWSIHRAAFFLPP